MHRISLLVIGFLLLMSFSIGWAQEPAGQPKKGDDKKPAPVKDGKKTKGADRQGKLKAGDPAPAFTVQDMDGEKTVALAQLTGKPVVLYFGSCT